MSKINLNIDKENSDDNNFLYCWGVFDSRPNKIVTYDYYLRSGFDEILSKYTKDKNVFTEIIPNGESVTINDKILIKIEEEVYVSYLVLDRENENSIVSNVTFYMKNHDSNLEIINEILEKIFIYLFDLGDYERSGNLSTISINQGVIDIVDISPLDIDVENIDLYYNTNTLKDINKLVKKLKKRDSGLSIFTGPRGMGKTTIIEYISESVDDEFIFVPNNTLESTINNPEFISLLKTRPGSYLVIDDCEVLFNDVYSTSGLLATNLLQLIDGIDSASISLNIIMIFNTDTNLDIDSALLDCNNLIDVIEFDYLDIESSNLLSNHLNNKKVYKNKSKLIDIINNRNPADYKKVGF